MPFFGNYNIYPPYDQAKLYKPNSFHEEADGEECVKKIMYVTKPALRLAALATVIDLLMITKPKGYGPAIGRVFFVCTPIISSAVAFSSITCLTARARGQDGFLNYFIGGAAAGSIFGATTRSTRIGVGFAAAFGFAGLAFKFSKEAKLNFIPEISRYHHGDFGAEDNRVFRK